LDKFKPNVVEQRRKTLTEKRNDSALLLLLLLRQQRYDSVFLQLLRSAVADSAQTPEKAD